MITAIIALVTLVLNVTAFVLKNAILHFVSVITWLVFGVVMYNNTWPAGNTYTAIAFMLIALVMVIVNVIITLNHYLGQRTEPPTHDQIQSEYRRKILEMTGKKEPRDPWA